MVIGANLSIGMNTMLKLTHINSTTNKESNYIESIVNKIRSNGFYLFSITFKSGVLKLNYKYIYSLSCMQ